ncbi:hypothetical protein D3C80_1315240 [compost metagenome]
MPAESTACQIGHPNVSRRRAGSFRGERSDGLGYFRVDVHSGSSKCVTKRATAAAFQNASIDYSFQEADERMERLAFEPFVALQSQTIFIDAPAKFRYEPGFSDTGLADNGERPPVPGPCSVPCIHQAREFPVTPDHGVADITRG